MNLEESIKTIVESCDAKLYDIATARENDTNIFRVYITNKDGVSLDKCGQISKLLSPLLDVNSPINGKYNLEVSSPGIERKLKTLNHFLCSIGENIKIKEYSTETIKGKLIDVLEDGTIHIQDNKNDIQTTKFDDILSASTYFEWKK